MKAVLAHRFRYNAAVSLQWVLFGSNEHVTRPEGGQLRGYSRCTGVLSREMKCIANAYWLTPDQAFDTGPGRTDNHVHQCNVLCVPILVECSFFFTRIHLNSQAACVLWYSGSLI